MCAQLDPDFVVFPTYKWLLGPYGRAFIYVAKRHQNGIPLEQTSYGRKAVRAEQDVYFTDTDYVGDARRFDMGERDHFISMEMASIGMEMMADWGAQADRCAAWRADGAAGATARRRGARRPDFVSASQVQIAAHFEPRLSRRRAEGTHAKASPRKKSMWRRVSAGCG